MKLTFALLAASLVLRASAWAAVDLTPRFIELFIDGTTFKRVYFVCNDVRYTVSLNQETEVTPGAGGAVFRFKKFPDSHFVLAKSRHTPEQKFEGLSLERYRESAQRMLPPQAQGTKILSETPDCYPINGWSSYRFIVSYQLAGRDYTKSVTFVNLNDSDQVTVVASAPDVDFEETAHRTFQVFRTWQEILPSDEKGIRGN